MTIVNNRNFIGFDGTPITGRTPTQTIVMADSGFEMSPQLRGAVAHAYKLFCDAVTVSAFPDGYHVQNRKFQDGSKVRMESRKGIHKVMVWPVGGGGEWVRVYWLRTFDESPGDETGDFDTGKPSEHVITATDRTKHLRCFSGAASAVFQRNVSLDGMLEIFVEKNRKLYRANAAQILVDADDFPADADGPHTHEVDVWLAGDRSFGLADKRIPLPCEISNGSIVAFGNPYHGPIVGTVLQAAGGDVYINDVDITLPNTHLVKFDSVPSVPPGITMDWRNYAILHDLHRIYFPVMDRRLGFGHWSHLYRTDDGRSYRISMAWNATTHFMTVTAQECTVFISGTSPVIPETLTLYSGELTYPTHGGIPFYSVYPRFNISPNGKKSAVFLEAIQTTANLTTICDHRITGEGVAVYELVFSGGTDEVALACATTFIIGYNHSEYNHTQESGTTILTDVGNKEVWITDDPGYTYTNTYLGVVDEVDNGVGTYEYKYLKEYTELAGERVTAISQGDPESDYTHNTDMYFVKQTMQAKKLIAAWYGDDNLLQVIESEVIVEHTPSETWQSQQEINGLYAYSYYKYIWGFELQYQSFTDISLSPTAYNDTHEYVLHTTCAHNIYVNGVAAVSSTDWLTNTRNVDSSGTLYLHYYNEPRLLADTTTTDTTTVTSSRAEYEITSPIPSGANSSIEQDYFARHDAVRPASNNVVIYRTHDDFSQVGILTPLGVNPEIVTPAETMANGAANPTVSWNPGTNEILTGAKRSWA